MERFRPLSHKNWDRLLVNSALILICIFAMTPIVTTVLISLKGEQDIIRKPPVLLPCDTPDGSLNLSACRWSVEGYDRVIAPKPSETSFLGFALTGRMLRTYLPNTLLYASTSALVVVLLATLSGYAFSRYRFRGRI